MYCDYHLNRIEELENAIETEESRLKKLSPYESFYSAIEEHISDMQSELEILKWDHSIT